MDYAGLAEELAAYIRNIVRPLLGTIESRRVTGTASSGDATFSIDNTAEEAVVRFITEHELEVAYYTEDAGLKTFGNPRATLIIDPIDGSRGAKAGFECCVVSVAIAEYKEDVLMRDVRAGCIYEIKEDRIFVAERGSGVKILDNGIKVPTSRSGEKNIQRAAWTAEIAGRPAALTGKVLSEAIEASSISGGFFILNSTAFSLSRLVNGQLSAVVDVGGRLLRNIQESRENFLQAGHGNVVGLFPYDIAAGIIIAQETGCIVTDAYGRELDDMYLLDSSEGNIQSLIAACTPELHRQFLDSIDKGFSGLR